MITIRVLDKKEKVIKTCKSIAECCREFRVTRTEVERGLLNLRDHLSKGKSRYIFEIVPFSERLHESNKSVSTSKPFEVYISQSLSKSTAIWSDKYKVNDTKINDDSTGIVEYDTNDINWEMEYNKQHYTPIKLITALSLICTELLEKKRISKCAKFDLNSLRNECVDWIVDETVIGEDV